MVSLSSTVGILLACIEACLLHHHWRDSAEINREQRCWIAVCLCLQAYFSAFSST